MEKRKGARLQALPPAPDKTLLSAPEAAHPLASDISPAEEIDNVMSIFEEMDIEPVDVLDDESTLGIDIPKREEEDWEEEVPVAEEPSAGGDTSDPVRMYLQEMGNIPLLSRDEEVAIANEIEAAEKQVRREVFSVPLAPSICSTSGCH